MHETILNEYPSVEELLNDVVIFRYKIDPAREIIDKLKTVRQKTNESTAEYGDRVQDLVDRLVHIYQMWPKIDQFELQDLQWSAEQIAVERFVSGLTNPVYRRLWFIRKPSDLYSAIKIAETAELMACQIEENKIRLAAQSLSTPAPRSMVPRVQRVMPSVQGQTEVRPLMQALPTPAPRTRIPCRKQVIHTSYEQIKIAPTVQTSFPANQTSTQTPTSEVKATTGARASTMPQASAPLFQRHQTAVERILPLRNTFERTKRCVNDFYYERKRIKSSDQECLHSIKNMVPSEHEDRDRNPRLENEVQNFRQKSAEQTKNKKLVLNKHEPEAITRRNEAQVKRYRPQMAMIRIFCGPWKFISDLGYGGFKKNFVKNANVITNKFIALSISEAEGLRQSPGISECVTREIEVIAKTEGFSSRRVSNSEQDDVLILKNCTDASAVDEGRLKEDTRAGNADFVKNCDSAANSSSDQENVVIGLKGLYDKSQVPEESPSGENKLEGSGTPVKKDNAAEQCPRASSISEAWREYKSPHAHQTTSVSVKQRFEKNKIANWNHPRKRETMHKIFKFTKRKKAHVSSYAHKRKKGRIHRQIAAKRLKRYESVNQFRSYCERCQCCKILKLQYSLRRRTEERISGQNSHYLVAKDRPPREKPPWARRVRVLPSPNQEGNDGKIRASSETRAIGRKEATSYPAKSYLFHFSGVKINNNN